MAVNKVVINHDGVENVLVDITDSTVTPETLAWGETAYDKSGEKISGNLWWLNEVALLDTTAAPAIEGGEKCVMLYGYAQEKGLLDVGNMIRLYSPTSNFGDANKNEVMRGKIFTSAEGFRLYGTGGKDVVFLYDPSFLSIPESPGSVRLAVNVDASVPVNSAPCSAPAAPASLCISITSVMLL